MINERLNQQDMSRFFTSLLCICLLIPALNSCKKGLPVEQAVKHGLMDQAIAALENDYKSTKKLEEKKEIAAKLGELYAKINNYAKADIYYKTAVRDGAADPETYYQYAQVLKAREKYEDALEQLRLYEEAVPGSGYVAKEIELCESAIEWANNPVQTIYRVEEERALNNGKFHDFAPVITNEGVVFTSNRSGDDDDATGPDDASAVRIGQSRPDLFIAEVQRGKKSSRLQSPKRLETEGLINTEMSEGSAAFANNGKLMIYTSCNRPYEQNNLKRNDSNCVLMTTTRKGKSWGETERLPFCVDSGMAVHYGQPTLSEDGQKLYFSSNMSGGYGGYDIWVCTYVKRSKTWSDPINLGPVINSAKDEMYPHIYGERLYFSSNGHPGVGGLDIFESTGRGNEWSEPYNLLPPMNSGADDFSIFFERDKKKTRRTGDYGYLASNRGSSAGTDNIYSFKTEPLIFTVSGYVYDSKTKEPIADAKVTLSNFSDTSKVFVKTNDLGYYFMQLDGETNYDLRAYKERYENPYDNPTVSTIGYRVSKEFERDMYLDPFRVEFELDILYDLDSFVIRPDAAKLLDSFALTLKEHYYTQMELSSHTDSRGSDDYNRELAQKRAESAVNYLISKGIEKERLVPAGYGEDKPKVIKVDDANNPLVKDKNDHYVLNVSEQNENPTEVTLTEAYINKFARDEEKFEALHQMNRRTEIRILSWEYKPKEAVEEDAQEYDPSVFEEEELDEEEDIEEEEEGGGL